MPNWPAAPPSDDSIPQIRIVRANATGKLRFTSFSRTVTGAMTHYAGARTQLCVGPDCPECRLHHQPRWYGYLAVFNPETMARRLFEFPKGPYGAIRDHLTKWRDMLGARISTYRSPQRSNGPVWMDILAPDESIKTYPPEVDVFRLLCQIWKLRFTDQLLDYNDSNLNDAHPNDPKPAGPEPPNQKPHGPKDKLEDFTRGLDFEPPDPPTKPDGPN